MLYTMKTIAHFISPFYLPYSETFIYDQLKTIQKFNQIVITPELKDQKHFTFHPVHAFKDTEKNIHYSKIKWLKKRQVKKNKLTFFTNILKEKKVDLIHAHFGNNGVYAVQLKKRTGIPLAVHLYGQDASRYLKIPKWLKAYSTLFNFADLIFVVSKDMLQDIQIAGLPIDKIIVLPIGIDTTTFIYKKRKPVPKNKPVKYLFIGRLTQKKNPVGLIEAFNLVSRTYPSVQLSFIGDGELKNKMTSRITALKLNRKITFHGILTKEQTSQELMKHHILVLPSFTTPDYNKEAIPSVLKEAMATGMPVISTNHAGIPELIEHNKNGYLVEEKNIVQLADKMIKLAKNKKLWIKFGLNGRKKIEKDFNLKKQVVLQEQAYFDKIFNKQGKK